MNQGLRGISLFANLCIKISVLEGKAWFISTSNKIWKLLKYTNITYDHQPKRINKQIIKNKLLALFITIGLGVVEGMFGYFGIGFTTSFSYILLIINQSQIIRSEWILDLKEGE
jgi:hypothetical protein